MTYWHGVLESQKEILGTDLDRQRLAIVMRGLGGSERMRDHLIATLAKAVEEEHVVERLWEDAFRVNESKE